MNYARNYGRDYFGLAVAACGGCLTTCMARLAQDRLMNQDEPEFADRPRSTPLKRFVAKHRQWLADSAPKYPRDDELRLEFHEAGHIVIGVVQGLIPTSVTVIATANALGSASCEPGDEAARLRMILAGPIAECIALGRDASFVVSTFEHAPSKWGWATDVKNIRALVNSIDGAAAAWPEDRKTYIEAERDATASVLGNWEAIRKVAHALYGQKTLTGSEVAKLMNRPDVGNKILRKRVEALQAKHESDLLHARIAEMRERFGRN